MTATADSMLDTNVLVYSVSYRPADERKRKIARELIAQGGFGLSAQVLAEFYAVTTGKGPEPLPASVVFAMLEDFATLPCVAVDSTLVEAGAELSMRHGISYWDGAIVAAAHRLGASVLLTEDLSHGQTYGSVRVENPFLNA